VDRAGLQGTHQTQTDEHHHLRQGEGRGLMTSKKCAAPMMCEALGREDILEEGCHMTCPASIEETAALHNPNMKMDVLAIPLGWTLTMCVAAGS
jgi:hypothetical protein